MTQKHTAVLYSERVELVTHYTSDRVLVIQRHALVTHYTSGTSDIETRSSDTLY